MDSVKKKERRCEQSLPLAKNGTAFLKKKKNIIIVSLK